MKVETGRVARKFVSMGLAWVSLLCSSALAQGEPLGLYHQSFGERANRAVIFVHGGPGHSSLDFELTTAERLSEAGYFVVTYDQRGQGRRGIEATGMTEYNYDV